MAAPKKMEGSGSRIQNPIPCQLKHPEKIESKNAGIPKRYTDRIMGNKISGVVLYSALLKEKPAQ